MKLDSSLKKKLTLLREEPLDEFAVPPKPPIELKPLPIGLRYAFLGDDLESPVIISDKLT